MTRNPLALACMLACFSLPAANAAENIDPEALFNQAMQSREDGEVLTSIELLEYILQHQPELNRARLELAVSYHMTRRFEDARTQLNTVLQDPATPETVKLTITAYLAQLSSDIKAAANRSTSSIYISAGAFSDSNINLGPDNIRRFTSLDPSAEKQSSGGAQLMLSYAHRSRASQPLTIAKQLVDFEWLSQLTAYNKAYGSGDSDFNLGVISFNTGPALLSDQNWRAALNIKMDKIFFGNDPYADYLALNPLFTYNLTDDMELTLENTTTVREHDQDQGLDGTSRSWNINLARFYTKQLIGVQVGVKFHNNGADDPRLHYSGAEIYLGGQMPAWEDARSYLTLSSRDYRYKAPDGTESSSIKRDETELLAVVGVSHNFRSGALKSWTLNAQYTYTDNDSNLDAFSYDRDFFELNMRRYFF